MITLDTIKKEKGDFEVCSYAGTIIETLYHGNTLSKVEFVQTLPEPLQVSYFINEMTGKDSLDEYVGDYLIELEPESEQQMYCEKTCWALEKIGENALVSLIEKVIEEYNKTSKVSDATKEKLITLDHRYRLWKGLMSYIKKHAKEIVSEEYKKKAVKLELGPAHKTEEYRKEVAEKYSWFNDNI